MKKNKSFFSQGTYGCVSFPPIKCKGIRIPKQTISKLSIRDFFSQNELYIGKLIEKIEKAENIEPSTLFSYYSRYCNVSKDKIKRNNTFYNKCKIVGKSSNQKKFVLLYGPYISQSTTLSSYLNTNSSWRKIFLFYHFSLKVCRIFRDYNIIHYDIKGSNILVSKQNKFHIIDFGMSISIDKAITQGVLNREYLYNFLIFSPSFKYWSIEHHILSYYFEYEKELSLEKLKKIISKMCNDASIFIQFTDIEHYKKEIFDYYSKKLSHKMSIEERTTELFISSYKTWDMYSICYTCLSFIYKNKLPLSKYTEFIDLLQKGIHYDYTKRLNISERIHLFHDYIKNSNIS